MKVLVCIKTVYDLDSLNQDAWKEILEENMTFSYIRKLFSCFDEAALELGIRLTEELDNAEKPHSLTAVTIDPSSESDNLLKGLFALKFDRVCKIVPSSDLQYSPLDTAQILADFVLENGGYDLIFMGQQSIGSDNGQTHWILSELLGMPTVTNLSSLTLKDDHLLVKHVRDNYIAEAQVTTPSILIVENAENPYLRFATLREKMAASKNKVEIFEKDIISKSCEPVKIWQEVQSRKCKIIEGENTAERVEKLVNELKGVKI